MKSHYISLFLIGFLFSACTNEAKIKKSIRAWEKSDNQIEVVQFVLLDTLQPFTSADSVMIIEKEFEQYKTLKFIELNFQLEQIEKRVVATEQKVETTDNALMKKAIGHKLYELEVEKRQVMQIIAMYTNSPSETEFSMCQNNLENHKSNANEIIAFKQAVQLIVKQGELPVDTLDRTYVIHMNLNLCLGIIDN